MLNGKIRKFFWMKTAVSPSSIALEIFQNLVDGIASDVGDGRQRVAVEMVAHMSAGLLPDREQHALTLVVAGAILMRLAEVAERDRAVDGRDDRGQSNLLGWTVEDVAAAHPALGPHEPSAFQGEQDLFEVRLGESGAFGNVAHRRGRLVPAQRERQQGPTGVVAAC